MLRVAGSARRARTRSWPVMSFSPMSSSTASGTHSLARAMARAAIGHMHLVAQQFHQFFHGVGDVHVVVHHQYALAARGVRGMRLPVRPRSWQPSPGRRLVAACCGK
jgi:hypothetical protein